RVPATFPRRDAWPSCLAGRERRLVPRIPRIAAALGLVLLAGCGGNTGVERVILPPGTPFKAVTDSLIAHRVVTSRRIFKWLARVRGVSRSVQAGIYEFQPGVSVWSVLDVLAAGKGVAVRLTVPEGLTLQDVAALAAQHLDLPEDSVLAAARDGAAATALLGF